MSPIILSTLKTPLPFQSSFPKKVFDDIQAPLPFIGEKKKDIKAFKFL